MKFTKERVMNFEGAFRGLRNPLESWAKSDSRFGFENEWGDSDYEVASYYCVKELGLAPNDSEAMSAADEDKYYDYQEEKAEWLRENGILTPVTEEGFEYAYIGPTDLDLAHRMIQAGSSDRKFLRQIMVSVDITAPLYWWKEFDTYKVGTVANSTSTMHKLSSTPITKDCFELGDFEKDLEIYAAQESMTDYNPPLVMNDIANNIIDYCESLRILYNTTKDKKYWKELIRWLPNGWLQTRTVTLNYEILRNMYAQRKNHRLVEWHQFCDWIKTLPYAEDLILYANK